METLILSTMFFFLMLVEIVTDVQAIRNKKKLAHLLQLLLPVIGFWIGFYYSQHYGIDFKFLWMIAGYALYYKGIRDYFHIIRSKLDYYFLRLNAPDWLVGIYAIITISLYPAFLFLSIICFDKAIG